MVQWSLSSVLLLFLLPKKRRSTSFFTPNATSYPQSKIEIISLVVDQGHACCTYHQRSTYWKPTIITLSLLCIWIQCGAMGDLICFCCHAFCCLLCAIRSSIKSFTPRVLCVQVHHHIEIVGDNCIVSDAYWYSMHDVILDPKETQRRGWGASFKAGSFP